MKAVMPVVKRPANARRSVSAEAYGDWNRKADFVAQVIPKTAEQKEKILAKLRKSFIFMALDAKELEIVAQAMEEKRFDAGCAVIRQGDEGDNLYVVESGQLTCVRRFVSRVILTSFP